MDNEISNAGDGKKTAAIIIAIVAIIAIGLGFYFSSKVKNTYEETVTQEPAKEDGSEIERTINTKHQYKEGRHTFAGEIDLPTPCHLLESSYAKDAAVANKFRIDFKTTYKGEICTQVITARPFKVTFDGPKDIEIEARLDGRGVKLNLFEVRADEDISKFEIFIKG